MNIRVLKIELKSLFTINDIIGKRQFYWSKKGVISLTILRNLNCVIKINVYSSINNTLISKYNVQTPNEYIFPFHHQKLQTPSPIKCRHLAVIINRFL